MGIAIGLERVSAVVGYLLSKGNFQETNPNLPQRIVILAEANYDNQGSLDTAAKEVTSADQAGTLYGFGSPTHGIMRILRPVNGGGVQGIPTIVMPQAQAPGALSKKIRITASGTATGNGVHTIKIAGRTGLDGGSYDINIESGDSIATIHNKIEDVVNAVLSSPVIATDFGYDADLETKWKGLTANDLQVSVDNNGNALGISYAVSVVQAGQATPSISAALALFQNEWNTIVINSYGTHSTTMGLLEQFNGRPDPENPTGRFVGIVFKPFIAITGSVADDPSSITDSRLNDCTIAIAPAPGSAGFPFEAAANIAVLFARQSQDAPNGDILNKSYPDMPAPIDIGTMADYNSRDAIVKKGCSTVELNAGVYRVKDFVTTYHPTGENPPQYRWCRNLMLDFNVRYGYFLLEQQFVVGYTIVNDDAEVNAPKVIKPKNWKQEISQYAVDLVSRALVADANFMQASITVGISSTNPDRIATFFRYQRTGTARIASTEAQAGFNFGTSNS